MSTARPFTAANVPGLRTFTSARFRMIAATLLAVMGILSTAWFMGLLPGSGRVIWLEDFLVYFLAAERLVADGTPYLASQLTSPVDAVCHGCYLYPPFLAQVLVPFTALPVEAAKYAWLALVLLAAIGSVWLALGINGARPTGERALWSVAGATFFFPMFQNTGMGNTSSLLALGVAVVALGGVTAGLAVSLSTLLKLVPGAFIPVVLPTGRRPAVVLLASLAVVGLVCFALAPTAWLEYPAVLRNMLAGSGDVPFNLAISNQVARLGAPDWLVTITRLGSIVLGLACMGGGAWLARRPGGLPAAALVGTVAMLLIPGTLWYHYLAVLLPIAAMAWVRGDAAMRVALLVAAAVVNFGGTWDAGISLLGAVALVLVSAWVLWPRAVAAGVAVPERRLADPT